MRPKKAPNTETLVSVLTRKVVGQPAAIKVIVPYIEMAQAGLAPSGRPIGVFLLLGPTGTGKTRTVEVLAGALHGSEKSFVRIDCGEFQMEHEVAKLIGAPPGYLGHRETTPVLTQQSLRAVTSPGSDVAIVLFDEIEKAAPSMTRLLLGVLDRATLRLGDNSMVDFEKALIFLTSNLGAREMMKELDPRFGFAASTPRERREISSKLEAIALGSVRRRFSPEFVNRVDAVITYQPLDEVSLEAILNHQIFELQQHVHTRLGSRCFEIEVTPAARRLFLDRGTSVEYGARELKRVIHRNLMQPLAAKVARGEIEPRSRVVVEKSESSDDLIIRSTGRVDVPALKLSVLLVDDNRELTQFLENWMIGAEWKVFVAENGEQAREAYNREKPKVLMVDSMLSDGDGMELAMYFRRRNAKILILLMADEDLDAEERAMCQALDIIILRKPFLASYIMGLIRNRFQPMSNAAKA